MTSFFACQKAYDNYTNRVSDKNEVKIHTIREELSQALNHWDESDTVSLIDFPSKNKKSLSTFPRKKKLLEDIREQLKSL